MYQLKSNLENYPQSNDIVISTVHSFKGLEADTVVINKDLRESVDNAILEEKMSGYRTKSNQQIFNLYYVALTRAKHKILYNSIGN